MFGLQISDAVKDLIINIINIIVLFVIVKSLAYKPVKNFLDARKARIDESLKNAENKNAEADALKAQYEEALKQSKQESDKKHTRRSIPKRIIGLRAFRGGTLKKVGHKALNIVVVSEIDKRVVAMAFLH